MRGDRIILAQTDHITELVVLQHPDDSVYSDALFSRFHVNKSARFRLLDGNPIRSATGRRLYLTPICNSSLDALQLGDLVCTPITGEEVNRYFV